MLPTSSFYWDRSVKAYKAVQQKGSALEFVPHFANDLMLAVVTQFPLKAAEGVGRVLQERLELLLFLFKRSGGFCNREPARSCEMRNIIIEFEARKLYKLLVVVVRCTTDNPQAGRLGIE